MAHTLTRLKVMPLIARAQAFATDRHQGQLRKVGRLWTGQPLPYIIHPRGVAQRLTEAGATEDEIVAGLLHDLIEDGRATRSEIEKLFGAHIALLVQNMTDPESFKNFKTPLRKRMQADHVRKFPHIKRVKLADLGDNLAAFIQYGAPVDWSDEKIRDYVMGTNVIATACMEPDEVTMYLVRGFQRDFEIVWNSLSQD